MRRNERDEPSGDVRLGEPALAGDEDRLISRVLAAEIVRRTGDHDATRRAVAEAARADLRLGPIVDDFGR